MQQDIDQIEVKKIQQLIDLRNHILEVGCGDGRITCLLTEKAKMYVAMDTDKKELIKAKAQTQSAFFYIGSGEQSGFKENSFDVVLFTCSLHHQKCLQALDEAFRVLKGGGHVVIVEPAVDGEVQKLFHLFHDETDMLQNAQAAIKTSRFEIVHQMTFYTAWQFGNKDELYQYKYNKGVIAIDDQMKEKFKKIIGDKINQVPIVLQDKISIFVLRRNKRPIWN